MVPRWSGESTRLGSVGWLPTPRRLAPNPEAVKLATRVAEALGVAHARGVVHRALKPSNLFLSGGQIDQVKVLDFGIAQRESAPSCPRRRCGSGRRVHGAGAGAHQGAVDARADVFALGCVLFQCPTGAPPFEGDSPAAVLGKILCGETPRLRALRLDVPEDLDALDALDAQMMAKDPAQRPSDGANLGTPQSRLTATRGTPRPAVRPNAASLNIACREPRIDPDHLALS